MYAVEIELNESATSVQCLRMKFISTFTGFQHKLPNDFVFSKTDGKHDSSDTCQLEAINHSIELKHERMPLLFVRKGFVVEIRINNKQIVSIPILEIDLWPKFKKIYGSSFSQNAILLELKLEFIPTLLPNHAP